MLARGPTCPTINLGVRERKQRQKRQAAKARNGKVGNPSCICSLTRTKLRRNQEVRRKGTSLAKGFLPSGLTRGKPLRTLLTSHRTIPSSDFGLAALQAQPVRPSLKICMVVPGASAAVEDVSKAGAPQQSEVAQVYAPGRRGLES